MSLETDVANLVTQTTKLIDYVNGKKSGIDAAVAAAIAAVPETTRNWFVDQVNGLDTNPGTQAAPFRTLGKAIAATPASGVCNVSLLSDYVLDSQVALNCTMLVLKGEGGTRVLRPKYYPSVDSVTGATDNRLGGFVFQRQGSQLEMRELNLALPTAVGVVPAPTNARLNSLFRHYGSFSVPPLMAIQMNTVTVTKEAGFVGSLIGGGSSCLALGCGSVSFPSDFGGFYIEGVPAGTAANTITRLLTNLATL
ncbi:hypothetical protein KC131_18745 [Pseudomonas sp. JQ170]|uniref:DUF1565 domain-containing protein n=1 Tax=unclassified Pseudomonas TaxID=196821 RepID=UPI002656C6B4|nr:MULTISPECIES: DUF1565 domain-containing protein [unclassified Pseudomonas]MDN7142690.1 hypothetical protein [Pseudomonas sp. JQ170]WRO77958.1 DUF1565 domain-containing protein [Pseudomonas sp. 170C]